MKLKENKIGVSELKKELKNYSQKELIDLITDCYKASDEIKSLLSTKFIGEAAIEEIYEISKKQIRDEFFPDRGFGKMRLANAKKAITNIKKICSDETRIIDLMIYYVEMGVEFTNEYGDIDENFYYSMETMYESVINLINQIDDSSLFLTFEKRLKDIVDDTDGIGWGFHDTLKHSYYTVRWIREI